VLAAFEKSPTGILDASYRRVDGLRRPVGQMDTEVS